MVVRVATFNTALSRANRGDLARSLASQNDRQAQCIAQIIKEVSPDILLLNEFDYDGRGLSLESFQTHYVSPITDVYPYTFIAPVNTGMPSGRDLNKDGVVSNSGSDALGYGFFPGQYGMAMLSRFPIKENLSRTFQQFLWKDFPDALLPKNAVGDDWFDLGDLAVLPLSSKSHWDIAIEIDGRIVHFLCSHPTPPVFDGAERRNACRNHDEIRFWTEYLNQNQSLYDDCGHIGGLAKGASFVILGDLNASVSEGDSLNGGIGGLLSHPRVNSNVIPSSKGSKEYSPNVVNAEYHTASWKVRADYVLSSVDLAVVDSAVFWPDSSDSRSVLVTQASDHRLVYLDLSIKDS
ncbi:endonuclease/exonuclease/phosphatase family protein [Marinomonas algicola]|uniref:endonuclease/exonuclease/phosphatase family protein n=1 Tax=Marinomonas algicola TaxID=2773454 RepID=UPI00174B265B|nr:endonuclease/exonuclease/phosphatase family protein [Marinomonas algicola]